MSPNQFQPAKSQSIAEKMRPALVMISRIFLILAGVTVLVAGAGGLYKLYDKMDVPIAFIGVDGAMNHVTRKEVEATVAANLKGGFLSLDLGLIRQGLEQHSWVSSASVRRKWPDGLDIVISEEVPIARWGKNQFLNNRGQVLDVGAVAPLALPLLTGPEGMERRVMQQYRTFTQLLQPTELKIAVFHLGLRDSWDLAFKDGPRLMVGRGQIMEKLQRFLLVWEQNIKAQRFDIDVVDIRYGNGVAVSWKNNEKV